jgi:hypothetical protein
LPWEFDELSSNPSITWKAISQFPRAFWDWGLLSLKSTIPKNVLASYVAWEPDEALPSIGEQDTRYILRNSPWEVVKAIPGFDSSKNMATLSLNPNLTWQIVSQNDIPWDWEWLSENPFNRDPAVRKRLTALAEERDVLIGGVRAECDSRVAPVLTAIILEYAFLVEGPPQIRMD